MAVKYGPMSWAACPERPPSCSILDSTGPAVIQANLGDAYHASERHQEARNAWQQALPILEEVDRTHAEEVWRKVRSW